VLGSNWDFYLDLPSSSRVLILVRHTKVESFVNIGGVIASEYTLLVGKLVERLKLQGLLLYVLSMRNRLFYYYGLIVFGHYFNEVWRQLQCLLVLWLGMHVSLDTGGVNLVPSLIH
jgi:hypothetical protein